MLKDNPGKDWNSLMLVNIVKEVPQIHMPGAVEEAIPALGLNDVSGEEAISDHGAMRAIGHNQILGLFR